jgi:hypothetical protein
LAGNATSVIAFVLIVVAVLAFPSTVPDLIWPAVWWLFPLALLGQVASIVLWLWRTCDRCAFRLFPLIAGNVTGIGYVPRIPDYRAERFFGSHHWGAIVSMATKGAVHCARCGHEDGVKPDYVVTSPQ